MIGRGQDNERADHQRSECEGFIKGRGDKPQHQREEASEGRPVQCPVDGIRLFGQKPARAARDPVNGQGGDRPGRDDPQRRAFRGVIEPQVGLRSPAFDHQSARQPDQNDQAVRFQIRLRHDGQRHEQENAQQQPVHVVVPGDAGIHVAEVFLHQRPPDVNDEHAGEHEGAQQVIAVASPAEKLGDARNHGLIIQKTRL